MLLVFHIGEITGFLEKNEVTIKCIDKEGQICKKELLKLVILKDKGVIKVGPAGIQAINDESILVYVIDHDKDGNIDLIPGAIQSKRGKKGSTYFKVLLNGGKLVEKSIIKLINRVECPPVVMEIDNSSVSVIKEVI